jgi:hypothetical protein|tara:strand:- start:14 stop:391 length:378 start_codon:yes stop_codon:yes gene_type:complete
MAEQSKAKNFDVSKYQISPTTQKRKVVIEETGDEFEVSIKPLSWAKRNQIVSNCLQIGANGSQSFNGDLYIKECLKEMIVEAPWGRTSEVFLSSIDSRLGAALEALVPSATESSNAAEANEIKKG